VILSTSKRGRLEWSKDLPSRPRVAQIFQDILALGKVLVLGVQQVRQFSPLPLFLLLNDDQSSFGLLFNLLAGSSVPLRLLSTSTHNRSLATSTSFSAVLDSFFAFCTREMAESRASLGRQSNLPIPKPYRLLSNFLRNVL
jgi:hypothetical protein